MVKAFTKKGEALLVYNSTNNSLGVCQTLLIPKYEFSNRTEEKIPKKVPFKLVSLLYTLSKLKNNNDTVNKYYTVTGKPTVIICFIRIPYES